MAKIQRSSVFAALAAVTLVASTGCSRQTAASSGAPPDGTGGDKVALQFYREPTPVAAFAVNDLDGKPISPSDWRGKVTIVNFWATWCPPCRAEIPDLIALQAKYHDTLQIIGVSEDDDPPEKVKAFAAQNKMNYRVVMTTPEIRRIFTGVNEIGRAHV